MKAFAFCMQAGELGEYQAYYYLSHILSQGLGVPSNSQLADKYLLKASEFGIQGAAFELLVNTFNQSNSSEVVDEIYAQIKVLAAAGHEASACWLEDDFIGIAICYLEGDGVLRSRVAALIWLDEAIGSFNENNFSELSAIVNMFDKLPPETSKAVARIQQKYGSADFCLKKAWELLASKQYLYQSQAFSWFKSSVEKGNHNGLKGMAKCYAEGIGCEKDDLEANRLFHRLASKYEDIDSAYDLALRLDDKIGYESGRTKFGPAKEWYQFAGLRGHIPSACNAVQLFDNYSINEQASVYKQLLKVAVKSGDPQILYEYSRQIAQEAPKKSRRYLLCAASGGSVGAMYDVGRQLLRDKSTLKEGLTWLHNAGEKNHTEAAYELGIYFSTLPEDTKTNIKTAVRWLEIAAKKSHTDSMYLLGDCYMYKLENTQERSLIAIDWYRKAAEAKHPDATFELGWAHKNGYGVSVDYIKAKQWFKKASLLEHDLAEGELEELDQLVWEFYRDNK
ncbi:tetratricopeptide repeat protein [Vibrio sp. OPT18]|uniref:tetratricopeptide repeat protein n=1 Tax=Vibrio sp. OPT18 TaxID=2778641 RepID=UPI0018814B4A|nr:SEL1-like repeat protein [Vibrio sp. OPT18]MBE8578462.1 sel1 repeat family protein [Vibrio sp. OPT18]